MDYTRLPFLQERVYPLEIRTHTCILNNHAHLVNAGDFNEVLAVEEGMISPRQGASLEDITVIAPPSTGPACGCIHYRFVYTHLATVVFLHQGLWDRRDVEWSPPINLSM